MDELYEILGLDSEAPTAQVVEEVKTLKQKLKDKDGIIKGLTSKVENMEDKFDSLADGVAEARVKDLVRKVQHETGRHVGKDHMETLQNKAAQYLYASDEEKEDIYNDMKAHTLAYGTKVGLDDKIKSLQSTRSEEDNGQSKEFNEAQKLLDSGEADNWEEAYEMVQEQRAEQSETETE